MGRGRVFSNTVEFIVKANKKHNNKYDYSLVNYTGKKNKITIICPIHGSFEQKASLHLEGRGCRTCNTKIKGQQRRKTTDAFLKQAKEIHGDKYDYSKSIYVSAFTKIKIICHLHGEFEQEPSSHIRGFGCKKCASVLNGFGKSKWVERGKGKLGIYYILRCWNENESFYKLGITFNSVKERYAAKVSMPYNYEIIKEIKSYDLEYIWDLENTNKQTISRYDRYKPKIEFQGCFTECFTFLLFGQGQPFKYVKKKAEELYTEYVNKYKLKNKP